MKMELHVHSQRRDALLFLITNMAAVTSSANRQCTSIFYFLGARDFSSAVSGFCRVFIAARGFGLRPTAAEDVSAFGQHRKFPLQARKTSGTQGNI